MTAFFPIETAALRSIFSETPEDAEGLERQLATAAVRGREFSGKGFFTSIAVADDAPKVVQPAVRGGETHATVSGLDHGLGFVLFMKDGHLDTLEGFAFGESTSLLDFSRLDFELFKASVRQNG